MSNQQQYAERLKRINDAIAMKPTDRVPCIPFIQTFPHIRQGHTMAQVLYNADMAAEDNMKYHLDYQPDMAMDYSQIMAGEGPMLEKLQPKFLRWAGQPGINIDENSIHQFIEKAYLEEDEYPELLTDYSGWILNRWLPRNYVSMESFTGFNVPSMIRGKPGPGMRQFMNPAIADAFQLFAEVAKQYGALWQKTAAYNEKLIEAGFPIFQGGGITTAFDALSDSLRGTLGVMMDLLMQPEYVHTAVDMFHERNVESIRAQLVKPQGKFIFIPLHKGFDGFMSPAQYEEFYWPTLKSLVEEILKAGGTPMIYTEGKYDSRLETIADVPAGQVVFHFETVDMKEAKRIVGKKHCISGGFNSRILKTHTPDQIRDEVKRFLDVVAVDGGYIFDIADTLDDVTDECVEAMVDTVVTYGKY